MKIMFPYGSSPRYFFLDQYAQLKVTQLNMDRIQGSKFLILSKGKNNTPLTSSLYLYTPSLFIIEIDVISTNAQDFRFLNLSNKEEHTPLYYDQVVKQTSFPFSQKCLSSSKVKVYDPLKTRRAYSCTHYQETGRILTNLYLVFFYPIRQPTTTNGYLTIQLGNM